MTAARRPDTPDPLHDWLTSRVDKALDDEDPTDRSWATSTSPLQVSKEITRSLDEEEDVEDPETVLAGDIPAWQESEADDATVQISRMPVSFISESVMDDNTVADQRLPPGWRQMLEDDEARATPPAARPPRPDDDLHLPAPEAEEVEEPEEAEEVPTYVWVTAGLLVAGGAVTAVLLLI